MTEATTTEQTATAAQDVDAEQYLLAAAMWSQDAYEAASRLVNASAFYRPAHAAVWATIAHLRRHSEPCGPVLVVDHLRATGDHATLRAVAIHQIFDLPWIPSEVPYYARIVARAATRRAAAAASVRLVQASHAADPDAFRDALTNACDRLTALAAAWDKAGTP